MEATQKNTGTNNSGLESERWKLLKHINEVTDAPMIVLSVVWLVLITIDLVQGLSRVLEILNYSIWSLFIADFLMEWIIAPRKGDYFRRNWLTVISLVLPAFRILRIFQALRWLRLLRTTRSLNLIRLITSLNRGMKAIRTVLARQHLGYVLTFTLLVTLAGAAGMRQFEPQLQTYGEALWWTSMVITTMGSEYWPRTAEGRILCWLLAVYSFAIFGYITATIATLFLGKDAQQNQQNLGREVQQLQSKLMKLQEQMTQLEISKRNG
jgi:voltage-gated potassium channel